MRQLQLVNLTGQAIYIQHGEAMSRCVSFMSGGRGGGKRGFRSKRTQRISPSSSGIRLDVEGLIKISLAAFFYMGQTKILQLVLFTLSLNSPLSAFHCLMCIGGWWMSMGIQKHSVVLLQVHRSTQSGDHSGRDKLWSFFLEKIISYERESDTETFLIRTQARHFLDIHLSVSRLVLSMTW